MATGMRTAAQMSLDVTGNVDGLVLSMTSGVSVPGSLRVEGQPLPATPAPRVTLRSSSPTGLSSPLQPINADGTFTLLNVFPGEYRVMVTPMPPDYYIKEARNEQADVLNQPWVIGNAIRGNLEVVLSSAAGQIEGTVIDARSQPVGSLQTVSDPGSGSWPTGTRQDCRHGSERPFQFPWSLSGQLQDFCLGRPRSERVLRPRSDAPIPSAR